MKRLYGWRGILCASVLSAISYMGYVLALNEGHRALGGGVTSPDYAKLNQAKAWSGYLFAAYLLLLFFSFLFAIYAFTAGKKRAPVFFLPSLLTLPFCWGADVLLQNFYMTPAASAALLLEAWFGSLILAALVAALCFPPMRRRKEKRR